jgi:hypothetical protein
MKHYNCRNNADQWDKIAEAVQKWAKAKGVNPEHVFSANDWEVPKYDEYISGGVSAFRCKPALRLLVKGPINTSVFEEAIIEDQRSP